MTTLIERMGDYVQSLAYQDLDFATVDFTKRILLDSLACGFGGLDSEPACTVRETIDELGSAPQATLFGQSKKTSVAFAALANGVAIRYMDYNDTYCGPAWTAHPSDSIGSFLATAEWCGRSGKEFLVAMIAAYEIQMHFSDLPVKRMLWLEGWDHSVAVAYASAAGVAKLLGSNNSQIAHAMALSGARANTISEIRAGDIPMDKALSAPVAASNSVFYALLAKRGFTGCMTLLEGKYGFQHAVVGGIDISSLVPQKGKYLINKMGTKPYPVSSMNNAIIDAALAIRKEHNVQPEEIQAVHIQMGAGTLIRPSWGPEKLKPVNKETADHSFPYCAAVAFIAGEVTARQFTDEWLKNQTVARLISVTTLEETPKLTEVFRQGHRPAAVQIKTARGTFFKEVLYALGDPENPMTWEHMATKFKSQAEPILGAKSTQIIIEQVHSIENVSNMQVVAQQLGQRQS